MDRLEHRCDLLDLRRGDVAKHVSVEMHGAALPWYLGVVLGERLDESHALIGYEQLNAVKAALFERSDERSPPSLVLFSPLGGAEDFSVPIGIYAEGDEDRYIAYLVGPGALEHDAVEVHVRERAFDRPGAPQIDLVVQFLVELRDDAGGDAGSPERFGDVLDPTHGNAGEVHLHKRFLHRAFAPAIAVDDSALERYRSQFRHLELNPSGLGIKRPLIVPGSGIDPIRASSVALGAAQFVGFGVEHLVERLFDRLANDTSQLALHEPLVDAYNPSL